MIRIIIADDHPVFRDGLVSVLTGEPNLEIVGEANNGGEVIDMLGRDLADIVLMDVNMSGMDGMEATAVIRERFETVKIIMLTMHNELKYFEKALDLGVDGYILKNTAKEELLAAINMVTHGGQFFSNEVKDAIMRSRSRKSKQEETLQLTRREKDILTLICEELTTPEIAERLHISPSTVETHRKNLISKTGVKNAIGLVKYAFERELIKGTDESR